MLRPLLFDLWYAAQTPLEANETEAQPPNPNLILTRAVTVAPSRRSSIIKKPLEDTTVETEEAQEQHQDKILSAELPALSQDYFEGFQGRFRQNPIKFISHIGQYATGRGWRNYDRYIGQRVLHPTCGALAVDKLLSCQQVVETVDEIIEKTLAGQNLASTERETQVIKLRTELQSRARSLAQGLCTQMSDKSTVQRFMCAVHMILARLYNEGIHIREDEYQQFRKAAELAASHGQTLLLLPNHRSYIDPMVVTWLMYRLGHSLPTCITINSLNIPIIGNLLKKSGGAFIKRPFGEDPLYPVLVKEYMEQLLSEGQNMEIFIEGTRSRTGKLLPPKLGMLNYVIDAVRAGKTSDVIICPISIQYSTVLEQASFATELLGIPKTPESLKGLAFSGGKALQRKLGRIDFRFKTPFSLRKFLDTTGKTCAVPRLSPSLSNFSDRALLKSLAYRVLSDINSVSSVVPAAAVAAILLCNKGMPTEQSHLYRRLEWLKASLAKKHVDTRSTLDGLSSAGIVERSLVCLADAVGIRKNEAGTVYRCDKPFTLAFYRNQIVNHFVLEGIVALALRGQTVTTAELSARVEYLSKMLQKEFVFPLGGLETNLNDTMASLSAENIIRVSCDTVNVLPTRLASETLGFYSSLVLPFLDSHWTLCATARALSSAASVSSNKSWYLLGDVVKAAQKLASHLSAQGMLSIESANQVTLEQAVDFLASREIISLRSKPTRQTISFTSDSARIEQVLEEITEFRQCNRLTRDLKDDLESIVGMFAPRPIESSNAKGKYWMSGSKL